MGSDEEHGSQFNSISCSEGREQSYVFWTPVDLLLLEFQLLAGSRLGGPLDCEESTCVQMSVSEAVAFISIQLSICRERDCKIFDIC